MLYILVKKEILIILFSLTESYAKEFSKISIENVEFLSFNYALNDEKHKRSFEKYFNTITHEDNPFADLNLAYCKYGFSFMYRKIQ